jgi:hypothetical protein
MLVAVREIALLFRVRPCDRVAICTCLAAGNLKPSCEAVGCYKKGSEWVWDRFSTKSIRQITEKVFETAKAFSVVPP